MGRHQPGRTPGGGALSAEERAVVDAVRRDGIAVLRGLLTPAELEVTALGLSRKLSLCTAAHPLHTRFTNILERCLYF